MNCDMLIIGNAYLYKEKDGTRHIVQYKGIITMTSTMVRLHTFRFRNERGNACGVTLTADQVSTRIERINKQPNEEERTIY